MLFAHKFNLKNNINNILEKLIDRYSEKKWLFSEYLNDSLLCIYA
ncbi:hypothetical protein SOHN41_00477 [Shewanella sp. HN-41]|nr:hypothetical protein SOHN41_00477 [Shewanella sp. HN-41]